MKADLDVLWQPVRIGHVSSRNRIYMPAHQLSLPPADYGAYLAERARGGVGLIVTTGYPVHPGTARGPDVLPWDPSWAESVRQIVGPARALGVPVFVQITHMGASGNRRTDDIEQWGAVLAPSPIPSPVHRSIPKVIEEEEILEIVEGFALTAANVKAGGGDGVEIHGSHGYLVANFLSPYWNRRDDAWGGDTARRSRLALEIGRAVRARCGSEFVVGLKLSLDEYLGDVGTTPDETLRVLALVKAAGLFDYVCLSHTDYHFNHKLVPPACSGELAPLAANAALARALLGGEIPLLIQGSVRDMQAAAEIVKASQSDLVGLARAHIADPEIVNKARQGRTEETRRCVGANQGCWRRLGQNVSCTVNPAAGRELRYGITVPKGSVQRRKLLVIGGGPAGLKFAETAAGLGHEVTLWERAAALGGQVRRAARLPDYTSWGNLVEDLSAALRRRGVTIALDTEATADKVRSFGADEVILATGARWTTEGFSTFRTDRDAIPQAPGAHVLDPVSALDHPQRCGKRVLIVDDSGNYLPLGLARLLAAQGRQVTVVTADTLVGRKLEATLELPWIMPRVVQAGIVLRTSRFVERISKGEVHLSSVFGEPDEMVAVDTVVLSMMRRSEESLYQQLKTSGLCPRRIGDCVAPREVDDAVLEGFREAHSIG